MLFSFQPSMLKGSSNKETWCAEYQYQTEYLDCYVLRTRKLQLTRKLGKLPELNIQPAKLDTLLVKFKSNGLKVKRRGRNLFDGVIYVVTL